MLVSIGDIIDIITMITKVYVALNDARGSATDYRRTIEDIKRFHEQLDQIERLAVSLAQNHSAADLASSIRENVQLARETTGEYLSEMKKYEQALGNDTEKMNAIKRTFWKIDWFFRHRAEASEISQCLQAHRVNISTSLHLLNM